MGCSLGPKDGVGAGELGGAVSLICLSRAVICSSSGELSVWGWGVLGGIERWGIINLLFQGSGSGVEGADPVNESIAEGGDHLQSFVMEEDVGGEAGVVFLLGIHALGQLGDEGRR